MSEDVYDPYATGQIRTPKAEKPKPSRKRKAKAKAPTDDGEAVQINGIAAEQLRSIVERIERLEEEKKAIADDIKDVYGEAKANGFDTKALRQCVRLRKMDANEREEEDAILELYKNALGMV